MRSSIPTTRMRTLAGLRLLATVAIVLAPFLASTAGARPRAEESQPPARVDEAAATTPGGQAAPPAQAAATVPPLYSPTWRLASTRDVDFRVRPNAGLRLPPLFPIYSPFLSSEAAGAVMPMWSVKASLAVLGVGHERQSAKFQEYRDVRDGTVAGLEGHLRNGISMFNLLGRHLGLEDQDLVVQGGRTGKYVVTFGYDQTPHNFSFNSRSLYDGVGTGRLTISDRIQADLQSSTTTQDAADKIRAYQEQSAQTVEVGLLRKKVGVDFTLLSAYPFTIRGAASHESRQGTRPSMGSFGLGDFEELPWPVAFETRDVRVSFEYAKPDSRLYANGTYRASLFDNDIPTLRFDNPYRVTDTSVGAVGASFAAGPSTGLIVLPPSNQYQEATVTSVFSRLPRQTSLSGMFSVGYLRQNEPLAPFSTNTAAIMPSGLNATDPAALPRASAEAAMNTAQAQVRLTTQPASRVRLVGQYRFFNLANHETPFTMAGFIREDADLRRPATPGGTYMPVLAAYNRHTASVEGSVNLSSETRLALTYTFERMNRDFREVAWMNDHRVKASIDTHPASRLDLQASYERSMRNISDYAINQYNVVQGNPLESPMLPFVRKFDEAARERDEVQAIATLHATDALSLSGMALYGRDDFSKSAFGLLEDSHRAYSADASYVLTERLSLFGSYSFERYRSFMRDRQWTPAGVSNPYTRETGFASNSNWEARPQDDIDTATVGFEASLIPDRLQFNVAYTYSKTDGLITFASPLGVAANDLNPFEPAPFDTVDNVTFHNINPQLEYRLGERLALTAGYLLERFAIDDINYRGFTYTPRNLVGGLNAGLLMGSYLFPSYNVNVAYVRVKVGL